MRGQNNKINLDMYQEEVWRMKRTVKAQASALSVQVFAARMKILEAVESTLKFHSKPSAGAFRLTPPNYCYRK